MSITPNRDQFVAYASNERPGEVVMVNRLERTVLLGCEQTTPVTLITPQA